MYAPGYSGPVERQPWSPRMRRCRPVPVLFALWLLTFSGPAVLRSAAAAPDLTNDDFVVAIATSSERMVLAQATRAFRGGIRTYILTDNETEVPQLAAAYAELYQETYDYYPDDDPHNRSAHHSRNLGDPRAAVVPLHAHRHYGSTYKWLLYGDDDTVFFMPGVRRLLRNLDPSVPYALSDNLWYGTHHPRLEAVRCLPCGFDTTKLPAAQTGTSFMPRPACPYCTSTAVCPPGQRSCVGSGAHGGAGMIFSVGLMERLDFGNMTACLNATREASGGDGMLSGCLWRAGYAFTDPGHSLHFENPLGHITFDNMDGRHFLKHPIEALTLGRCRAPCPTVIRNAVSYHLRGRSHSSFVKAATAVYALVASHQAALEFLELQADDEGRAAAPGAGGDPREDL